METSLRGILPEGMLTENTGIDSQHEEIFSRIQSLQHEDLEASDRFVGRMGDLLNYLAEHFVMEERLAAEADIVFLVHGQSHARNLRLLNKAMEEVKSGRMEPRVFLRYIDYWFEQHINEFDKPFARALQARSDRAQDSAA